MADPARAELVLASASPFRRRMLEAAGVTFRVAAADVDEAAIRRGLSTQTETIGPERVADVLAQAKAQAVSAQCPKSWVIGADQVLAFAGELMNKPRDVAEAREQLTRLRGKAHRLHTAVCLAFGEKIAWSYVETATLHMRAFSDASLDRYLAEAGDRVTGIVGAYEIEGPGIQLFDQVEGDHFTIIGLPLLALLAELRARGVIDP